MVSDFKDFVDALQKLGVVLPIEQLSKLESSPSSIAWIKLRLKEMLEELPLILESPLVDPQNGSREWRWDVPITFSHSSSPTPTEYVTAEESLSGSSQDLGLLTPSKTTPPSLSVHVPQSILPLRQKQASLSTLPPRPIILILEFLVDFRHRADISGGCRFEAQGLLAMTWMCRYIRSIALDSPSLWGQILRVDSDSLPWFTVLLDRSAGRPICLCTYSLEQVLPLSPEREGVWELAIANVSRCIHLAYDDSKVMDHHPLQRLLNCHFPKLKFISRFRAMESVIGLNKFTPPSMVVVKKPTGSGSRNRTFKQIVYSATDTRGHVNINQENVLDAPILQTLRLFGPWGKLPVEENRWSILTVFELHGTSFNGKNLGGWTFHQFRYLLNHLSALVELSIFDSILIPHLVSPNQCTSCTSAVVLLDLRRLTICTHFAILNDFFACIKAPQLVFVDIRCSTNPRPLWIDKERRRLNSAYARDTMSGLFKMLPTDINYTAARVELYRNRTSYTLSAKPGQSYSFTFHIVECSRLTIEEIHEFFDTTMRAFQSRFTPFAVEHLVLGCTVPSERKYADSLRSLLIAMPRLTSIQADAETLETILTLSGIAVEKCFTGLLIFPNVTSLYTDHRLVDSLTAWSSLWFYMVWRTEHILPPITRVVIDIHRAYDLEELLGRCRRVVEKLPRFFKSLQVQVVSANMVHATYTV